jgi:hypothetical protein
MKISLENEEFWPLIPGFCTAEFVKELDRRSRAMFGEGLVDAHRVNKADPQSSIQWMSQSWGLRRTRHFCSGVIFLGNALADQLAVGLATAGPVRALFTAVMVKLMAVGCVLPSAWLIRRVWRMVSN